MSKIYAQSSSVISSNSQEKQNKNCQWIMMLKIIINTKLTNTTLGDEPVKTWILKAAENSSDWSELSFKYVFLYSVWFRAFSPAFLQSILQEQEVNLQIPVNCLCSMILVLNFINTHNQINQLDPAIRHWYPMSTILSAIIINNA